MASLIDLISLHSTSAQHGTEDVAIDVASSMICAYDLSATKDTSLSLRGALQVERNDANKLLSKNEQRAEIIVHLHRAVEAQLTSSNSMEDLQMHMTSVMDQDQLPEVLRDLHQDEPMLDFADQGHSFDGTMDMQFDSQTLFDNAAPEGLGVDAGPAAFAQGTSQLQSGNVTFAAQDSKHTNDLFGSGDEAGNSFFGQQNMIDGTFYGSEQNQQQTQQQQAQEQEQVPDLAAQDGMESAPEQTGLPMDDDDFWASLGVNNDY